MGYNKAYDQGVKAFLNGLHEEQNPYDLIPDFQFESSEGWSNGWHDAMERQERWLKALTPCSAYDLGYQHCAKQMRMLRQEEFPIERIWHSYMNGYIQASNDHASKVEHSQQDQMLEDWTNIRT